MERRRTRGEAEIEARLQTLDPDSPRYRVLAAARDFKASWVALGHELTMVREQGIFRDWGYTSFESYCRRELRLKTDTANKLTRSFSFLRDHEPDALEEQKSHIPVRELPPLDVVDLLSRAKERTKISEDDLKNIQEEVFSAKKAPTKGQVMRRFREVDPDAFRPAPKAAQQAGTGDLRKALLLAERLCDVLGTVPGVEADVLSNAQRVAQELRTAFEAVQAEQAQAAEAEAPAEVEQKTA